MALANLLWRRELLLALSLMAIAGMAVAGPLVLHPNGEKHGFAHQGPFVTTGDGAVLCMDSQNALISRDEGRTWSPHPVFKDPVRHEISNERALLRTREGTVIAAYMNLKEKSFTPGFKWGGTPEEFKQWVLPIYVCRSLDDGKTWEEPQKLNTPWCGCVHSMIQLRSGRIVLVGQTIIPEWRHATVMFVSDDQGKTWQRSNVLDIGKGRHDHAGSCEGTVVERGDGTLYQLLRTEEGFLYESTSSDGGLTWTALRPSKVPSVTCCAQMARLSDGRVALLWNAPQRMQPTDGRSRFELSLAFSSDDARTWTPPVVIAARYPIEGDKSDERRVSYPYLYERKPGELWITTMQGGLRMKIPAADVTAAEVPTPPCVIMFGDSTTAPRPASVAAVYADIVQRRLRKAGVEVQVLNRGIGGNTTRDARTRFERDVLTARPKLVVMQFGINDSAVDVWKNPPATEPRVSAADYEANLRWMAKTALDRGIKVILMTTNPLRWTPKLREMYGKPPYDPNDANGFERPNLLRYNDIVRAVAAELRVPLVDVHAAYADSGKPAEAFLPDGMHPNQAGHDLVADKLEPVVRATLSGAKPANGR